MSYKTDLENNNQRLENNNQDIDNIIQQVTSIPTFSDITATEEDVLVDKTYYGKGIKRTGAMNNIGQQTITPSTEKYMIAKGYHDGTGYVEAVNYNIDENILPENIKQGVTILNLDGTYTSDATAIAEDIWENTAYVNGQKVNGTLQVTQDITRQELENKLNVWSTFSSFSTTSNDLSYLFDNYYSYKVLPKITANNISNMVGIYNNCKNLIDLDVSGLNTCNVTDMSNIFNRL